MEPEQQQRIMGYFIEEARDHLNTIEQGLLNLQSTIEDRELLYEVYRAAHSVKGGAAMLGLHSIQKSAHRLEDNFKALEKITEQSHIEVDQQLESLFLRVFDTLQALIDNLSGPYGLTEETSQSLLTEVEPVFEALNYNLKNLSELNGVVAEGATSVPKTAPAQAPVAVKVAPKVTVKAINSAEELFFCGDVTSRLREMLDLFKKSDNTANRNRLIEICRELARGGETFDKMHWVQFLDTVEKAIAYGANSYKTLAPVVITGMKQAQYLVLSNRESEIVVDSELSKLLPPVDNGNGNGKGILTADDEFWSELDLTTNSEVEETDEIDLEPEKTSESILDDFPLVDSVEMEKEHSGHPPGPQMQPEELKSLADLFEVVDRHGGGIEDAWEEERLLEEADKLSDLNSDTEDFDSFFSNEPPSNESNFKPVSDDDDDLTSLLLEELESSDRPTPENSPADSKPVKKSSNDDPDNFIQQLLELDDEEQETTVAPESSTGIGQSLDTPDPWESDNQDGGTDEDLDWFEVLAREDNNNGKLTSSVDTIAEDKQVQTPPESKWDDRTADLFDFDDLFGSSDTEETVECVSLGSKKNTGKTDQLGNAPKTESTPLPAPSQTTDNITTTPDVGLDSDWEDDLSLLDDLLGSTDDQNTTDDDNADDGVLSDLDRLLGETAPSRAQSSTWEEQRDRYCEDDEFKELAELLEEPIAAQYSPSYQKSQTTKFDPIAKVPVKELDNLSNLIGELVVNRNSLEQDQERMRQFLDNLLDQVSLLSDVGQRMQDFYERSLLEISLLSNRQKSASFHGSYHGGGDEHPTRSDPNTFDSTELDRFTPFHTLSQEIIELVVRVRESAADIEFLVEEADQVSRQLRQVTNQLQEGLNKARMEQFAGATDGLKRPVRDLSIKCGKQAELVVEGRDTLIDKMLLGKLRDPLTHLVNNAIAHGIESPEVRKAAGKSPTGQITIKVFHQGNQTVLSVSDDGAGINVNRVKEKAIQKGLLTLESASNLPDHDTYNLLFLPGFTTQDQAGDIAGRGVGMDVVRTNLAEIRGNITTDSVLGEGTTFTIRLPLNMSISRALCCISDRARIAFPMDGVEDMIDVPREQIKTGSDGKQTLEWRGSVLPFRHLRELLTYKRHLGRGGVYGANIEEDMISVIVLRAALNYLAVQVDQVLVEQEIVIKQLEGPVPKPIGIAGATVLGDGQIVAIADVLELIDLATDRVRRTDNTMIGDDNLPSEPIDAPASKTEPTVLIVDDSITVRSLLSMTFEKSGYRVEEARDGKEAWEKLKSGLPCDIVFCDIEMPRMDGLELLSRMQKDPQLEGLPIAMLTSRGADRHRQMAYQLGARGYFTKPYLEEQLLEAAGRMLRGEIVGKPAGAKVKLGAGDQTRAVC
ncbi:MULTISPECIES: hybrid sensor histidine kinase/response regulator [Arthrospira]|jgi:chemotaxis protein histidine kinase CheA/ActR/RegA family two-component response regulator|uniref:histidine kinase n=1 Tax=Limnospira platensis NIES-46 TaxID=1236695 RepID=A0A5M3TBY7_LIMPL|nr:response regulator [Arthrospira platensis]AMW28396.1 chemotaxis protein CheA [Arthrospira platensis YZ]KDR56599.1 chemotaxis protein CheA [Arthrospira platensis str. Paraca]MBD2671391.1 response regulator [Arthrospira platensis FACHB-439]MBD2712307.1 response regulator [Arthrospira platensis FACHB-835]MDT9185251.1 response regulator [Limnospira sp. PMC 289.06]MDT9297437.1 response regulator [Arthrospira platensis PCC 7345]MDT9312945.1 response regulator [Limnospira sp. Paracas R14]QQW311